MSLTLPAYAVNQWEGYRPAAHHLALADKLQAVADGTCNRLMVFMPPRHGKSMLCSEFFPAWWLGLHPERQIITATYAQGLADDFGRKVRNLVTSEAHRWAFPGFRLADDSQSAARFHTSRRGAYFAVGAGGPITGRGADLLLIDDPIKGREDAESATMRQHLKDWYQSVARTRLMPGGAIVVIQTRWHEDDLAGWLLREHQHEGWDVLNLPALAEQGDSLGRPEGAPLWPEAYPLHELMALKQSLGSRDWAALYQQRPAPQGGGLVKISWFKRYDAAPANPIRIIQSWDTAMKAGAVNDPSVCTTWAETVTGVYLLDVLCRRLEYPELKRTIQSMAEKWNPSVVLIEDKASGQSVIQDLRQDTRLNIVPINPTTDKVVRLLAVTAAIEGGRVYLPNIAPWLPDYESELASFPNAPHDDQVDSTSQGLTYLLHGGGATGMLEWMEQEAAAIKTRGEAA